MSKKPEFAGLDTFDWEQWGDCHIAVARLAKDIPVYVRQMVSDDKEERETGIYDVFGFGQHSGMIVPATRYLIPYALEVLCIPDYSDHALLLRSLASVAGYVFLAQRSIKQMKQAIPVYDELVKGFEIYSDFLSHSDSLARKHAARILAYMQDDFEVAHQLLLEQFGKESNSEVLQTIINSLLTILADMNKLYWKIGDQTLHTIHSFVIVHSDESLQKAFAYKLSDLRYIRRDPVLQNFIKTVLEKYPRNPPPDAPAIHF